MKIILENHSIYVITNQTADLNVNTGTKTSDIEEAEEVYFFWTASSAYYENDLEK